MHTLLRILVVGNPRPSALEYLAAFLKDFRMAIHNRAQAGLSTTTTGWLLGFVCFVVTSLGFGSTCALADNPVEEMTQTAQRIVALLDEAQRAKCLQPFEGSAREQWNFVPDKFIVPEGKRNGLPLTEMTSQQRLLTHALLSTVLSNSGYHKAVSIMALEQVLFEMENSNPIRNSDQYYLSVYGQPEANGTWGWRFEGHHLSLNFTIQGGQHIAVTPVFWGSNPAEVRQGPLNGLRVLDEEESLARELVESLTPDQRGKAIVAMDVPGDLLTGNQPAVAAEVFGPLVGIPFGELSAPQQQKLRQLMQYYTGNFRSVSDAADSQENDDKGLRFVWVGDTKPGAPHYYRIQSESHVFEYDKTQNDANHIHAAWRDFEGDFGRDLLQKHYQQEHQR